MTTTYMHILDLAQKTEPPADGTLNRTVFQDDQIKAVVFGFDQGQELSEHTAARPAMDGDYSLNCCAGSKSLPARR
jgi:hypothetical protein